MKKTYLFTLFILLSYSVFTTIINIPANQPTIQAGINASVDGDTILVQPGTYVENINYNAGSLVIRRRGNPPNTVEILNEIAGQYGLDINGVNTGQSSSGSFLGAPTFRMLKQPKLAILTGEPLGTSSFGSLWNAIDFELEIPHSLLRISALGYANLDKYNVLIIPSAWGSLSNELTGYVKEKISGYGKKEN